MNRSTVTRADGTSRTVKNLGWLLRHWQNVTRFEVTIETTQRAPDGPMRPDVTLRAMLRGGTVYETPYASIQILWNWLHRPVFDGLRVTWLDTELTIVKRSPCTVLASDAAMRAGLYWDGALFAQWREHWPYAVREHGAGVFVTPDGDSGAMRSMAFRLSDAIVSSVQGGSLWFHHPVTRVRA